jgi:ubiquinone/menaquinone biosynthesis C-methylase UbiE
MEMSTELKGRIERLQLALGDIDRITNEAWLASLAGRKRSELEFHDKNRDREQTARIDQDTYERFYGNKKYYSATGDSKAYVDAWIAKNASGKVFLDYACGDGFNAIKAAKAGAALAIGIDISPVSIENARRDAAAAGVEQRTYFVQADAENTKLPDSSIDVVICSGMLHHLDLSYAFPELRRILVPGGRILAVEALDYNPAIKLYRLITPEMRTDWEKSHILSLKDITVAKRFFDIGEIRYWHITSILSPHMSSLAPTFRLLDTALAKIPLIQLLAWIFTFELVKRSEDENLVFSQSGRPDVLADPNRKHNLGTEPPVSVVFSTKWRA